MGNRADARDADPLSLQIRGCLYVRLGNQAVCSPLLTTLATITVSPPRNAAATKTSPAEFTICTSLAMQRADAGGPTLAGDDHFGIDTMFAKESFRFSHPHRAV